MNFVHYRAKLANDRFRPDPTSVEPDTSSSRFDGPTGTINVYAKRDDEISEYPKAIRAWIEDKKAEGYDIRCSMKPDTSGMYGVPVFRVEVVTNPSTEYEEIPEVNMSNGNAFAILRLLGLSSGDADQDYVGSIDLQSLRKRIEAASQEQMRTEVREPGYLADRADMDLGTGDISMDPSDAWKGGPIQSQPPAQRTGSTIYDGGRSEQYIDYRLQRLYELVDYGLRNGFSKAVCG